MMMKHMSSCALATIPHLDFPGLKYTRPVAESKAKLMRLDEPMVIISASGMAEAGRILHHLDPQY